MTSIYAIVYAYPTLTTRADAPAVQDFLSALQNRITPPTTISGGTAGAGIVDARHPMVILTFTLDQIPLPLEEVLEWLRDHPLVRVIEVDRFRDRVHPK